MSETEKEPLIKICSSGRHGPSAHGKTSWTKFRESRELVVGVVFVAMMLDLIVMTSIDPLLPNILHSMDTASRNRSQALERLSANNCTDDCKSGDGITNSTTMPGRNNLSRPRTIEQEEVESRVGIIIALKPGTEVVANIMVGAIVAKFGHITPMICGFIFNTGSTLGFAYAPNFTFLILARVCQAVASSLSVISGLALISCTFQKESERSKAISTAFGGLSLGIVLGYPFGSITYQFVGRRVPFIALAVLSLLDGLFRMLIAKPSEQSTQLPDHQQSKRTEYLRLLRDPYIISALICNFAPNLALGVFLATGPAWMIGTLGAQQWQIGTVLAIAIIFQIVTQYISGRYCTRFGHWKFCMLGMWLYSIGMLIYPHCNTIWMVILPEIFTRSGFGMVICVISPLLSHLVDIRYDSNYGEVFGLYTASYNIALTVGPLSGGFLLQYLSFGTLYRSASAFIFVISWLCFVFTDPKPLNIHVHNKDLPESRRSDDDFHTSVERSVMQRGQTT